HRSLPIVIDEGGLAFTARTTAQTVGEALRQAQVIVYLGDRVRPAPGSVVHTGLRVSIERSTPVSLRLDGRTVKTRTRAKTVGDALTEMNIGVAGLDLVTPTLTTRLTPDLKIAIVRVYETVEIEEEIAPFETIFAPDATLPIDTQAVTAPGAEGITRQRTRVRYADGQEVVRVLEDRWVAQEPAQRVIGYGQQIEPQTATIDGTSITYWRRIRMLASSYSANTAGVSPDATSYGRTFTGDQMRKGIVAVDARIIPLRSRVFVGGYGYGDALDTGGAIVSRRIDLGYDDSNLELWNRWVDVYLLWPPPPDYQITWVLPNYPRVPDE
ncbi:MAG: ubiquitin-like domain-containing protein, partial [Chloroflexota bacterium]|nr:ubiquitin-like domain-containing protein [Chloroflexota bacterium]